MTNPYNTWNDPGVAYQSPGPTKHSGLGIASFVIGLLIGLAEMINIVVAGFLQSRPGGMDQHAASTMMVGLVVCGGVLVALVGLGLGIFSLFMKGRKKIFGILGVVFNGLLLLGVGCLMLIGMMAS